MLKMVKDESGFTLAELLASFVIFALVLTSFLAFFYQSGTFTKVNEKNTEAINLSSTVVDIVRDHEREAPTNITFPSTQLVAGSTCKVLTLIDFDKANSALDLKSDGTFIGYSDMYPCIYMEEETPIVSADPDIDYKTFRVTVEIKEKRNEATSPDPVNDKVLTKSYGYGREAK